MTTEIVPDGLGLTDALAAAGSNDRLRADLFDVLRRTELEVEDPHRFRNEVRWPLVLALLRGVASHRVQLANGLLFDVGPDSRIEKALLLSRTEHPDHVWEPQTTKLLTAIATRATHIIVGGAYIGDHVLPMAKAARPSGTVHAFEPMSQSFHRLLHNVKINGLDNIVVNQLALWDISDVLLTLDGALALASAVVHTGQEAGDTIEGVRSRSITDYLVANGIPSVDLIMLDTEGGEERALLGARAHLAEPAGTAPTIVFELHRSFVDWTDGLENTSIVRLLLNQGYDVFAVRDIHDNYPMATQPVEIIPADSVYLDGPPHGFNMLAVKDPQLIAELGLRVVEGVSPKLIPDKDPALHHPSGGFPPS